MAMYNISDMLKSNNATVDVDSSCPHNTVYPKCIQFKSRCVVSN